MAKEDTLFHRGDKVVYIDDGDIYNITAVFMETVWIRHPLTDVLLKGIPKDKVYI